MWFPPSELSKVLECATGIWLDDRGARQSSYTVTLVRRGSGDAVIVCSTRRPDGSVSDDGGRVLKLQRRAGPEVRLVWGLREVRYVGAVEPERIIWTPTAESGRPYVWTKVDKRQASSQQPRRVVDENAGWLWRGAANAKPETAATAPPKEDEATTPCIGTFFLPPGLFEEETEAPAPGAKLSYADALTGGIEEGVVGGRGRRGK
jgi:hypothetical protein